MNLVLNGMEELNEQELMMVDGGADIIVTGTLSPVVAGILVVAWAYGFGKQKKWWK